MNGAVPPDVLGRDMIPRDAVLAVLAREARTAADSIPPSARLCDVLSPSAGVRTEDDSPPGTPPDEIALFLLSMAIEDEFGIDLVDHPAFATFWRGTVDDFIDAIRHRPFGDESALPLGSPAR